MTPAEVREFNARQKAARLDYHDRTKDSRGNELRLGDHKTRGMMPGGIVRVTLCGCEECAP